MECGYRPRYGAPMTFSTRVRALASSEALCAVAAFLVALKVVWSASAAHDLSLWDETLYLARGVRLGIPGFPNDARGLPPPEWGPVYSLFYALVHLFERDTVRLFFTSWSIVVVLTSTGVFALARALGATPIAALVTTAFLATTRFYDIAPYPSLFAALLLLGAALLVVRAETWRARLRWALLGLLLATFVRPEFLVAFLVVLLFAVFRGVQALRARRVRALTVLLEAGIVLGSAAVLFGVFGNPSSSERAFFAFGQHYALNFVQRNGLQVDPWPNWVRFFHDDFGDAKTIGGALRANPGAFLQHVWTNVTRTPGLFAETMEPKLMLGEPIRPTLRDAYAVVLIAGAALGIPVLWKDARRRAVVLLVAALGIATLVSILLVHPRLHYFQPIAVFLEAFAAVGIPGAAAWVWRRVRKKRAPAEPEARRGLLPAAIAGALALVLVPNPAHGWCVESAITGSPPPAPLEIEKTVATLRGIGLRDHVVVLEKEWGCAFYAGLDYDRVDEWMKNEPFDAYVKHLGIGVIVVTDWMEKDEGFGKDPEYRAFLEDPGARGFRTVPVEGTNRWIAIRNDVH